MSSYEGRQKHIRTLKMPDVEVWENQYPDRDYVVDLTIPEFTCICPKTALPDFALIKVCYKPDKLCLELKSLKLHLVGYRGVGIFHEHLVNKLMDDLVKACHPRWMRVEVIMNPRGGIGTTVTAEYPLTPPPNLPRQGGGKLKFFPSHGGRGKGRGKK